MIRSTTDPKESRDVARRRTGGDAFRIGAAGFAATAVAYGPARTGFGLFLPEFRDTFDLGTAAAGVVGGIQQAGYFLALLAGVLLVGRLKPRTVILFGGVSAAVGMTLVALSESYILFAVGIGIAGMSAAFSWSPYSDLAKAHVSEGLRGWVLSYVSTGTTFGIALSGVIAIVTVAGGLPWRVAWIAFVLCAVFTTILNSVTLPDTTERREEGEERGGISLSDFGRHSTGLFVVALSFGVVNAFYWSFSADLVASAQNTLPNAAPLLFILLGVAGFVGLLTGDLVERFGLRISLTTTLLLLGSGSGLLGVGYASVSAVVISAVLYGAGVMLMSALLAIWSSRVFALKPSAGFATTLIFFGLGGTIGPVVLGAVGDVSTLSVSFIVAGAIMLLNCLVSLTITEAR